MSEFVVKLRHDNGIVSLRVHSPDAMSAMEMIAKAENAPRSAVISVTPYQASDDKITPADAGCWLDGSVGWHNTYRVCWRAFAYGWLADNPDDKAELEKTISAYQGDFDPDSDVPEVMHDASNEATEYLQSLAPEDYYFEWDAGELCLIHVSESESELPE
jgi:hypothetical protein